MCTSMATRIGFLIISMFLSFALSTTASPRDGDDPDNINWWCDTTPHPGPCKYFMDPRFRHSPPKQKSQFRELMVQVAMERALHAHRQVIQFGQNCQNERQKSAWHDCLKLYESTILQLNRTHIGFGLKSNLSIRCTDFDAQTWLSTALTNIQTCKASATDLNVSDFISPLVSNNLTELISNSLAINGGFLEKENNTATEYPFPSWVSRNERRLLQASTLASKADLVVAKDGSGSYSSVQAAINVAARRSGRGRFIIYVKRGVYRENIEVGQYVNNVMLAGEGMKNTVITGSRSVTKGFTTFTCATAGIDGLSFMARDITFVNTAGPQNGQAVALRSSSDLSVFYRCAFQGYQDTLFVHSQRQFYRNCYIYGTIDFIFGNAAVVFQNCVVSVRRPLHGQVNVITAQGRDDPNQNTGISFHNSMVTAASDLKPVVWAFQTYLGRPWKQYSRVIFMKTHLDRVVHPMGWLAWQKSNFALATLYYGEYKNLGPRSSTRWRVRWRGFHVITSPSVASQFTVGTFIAGRSWLPYTGVPFTSDL